MQQLPQYSTAFLFQSTHPARGATPLYLVQYKYHHHFNPRTPRGVRLIAKGEAHDQNDFNPRTPRGVRQVSFSFAQIFLYFNPRTPRGVRPRAIRQPSHLPQDFNPRTPRGVRPGLTLVMRAPCNFNPRTPRGVRQQTLPKSREFAWLNLLICTRGRRLSIRKQTRLCSMKLSFMLFGCEPTGEGVSSWTSHATKSKVRLEGRSAYSQSARSSAHSDFPGNKSGDCPVRGP